jgi:hypothetical protein
MARDVKVYRLSNGRTPLSLLLANRHTHRKQLLWYDEKEGNRPIKFATNQRSIFEDEQDGHAIVGTIEFKDGALTCDPRRDATLIKFLEHHPDNVKNGGNVFFQMDHEKEAQKLIDLLDLEYEANNLARSLDIEDIEKVGYMIFGNKVRNLKTAELKRDVFIYARNNPSDFLDMFENPDANKLAVIEKALAEKYISFRKEKTELFWNLKDDKSMIMRVKKGSEPMDEVAKFLSTNQGMEVFQLLESLVSEI